MYANADQVSPPSPSSPLSSREQKGVRNPRRTTPKMTAAGKQTYPLPMGLMHVLRDLDEKSLVGENGTELAGDGAGRRTGRVWCRGVVVLSYLRDGGRESAL